MPRKQPKEPETKGCASCRYWKRQGEHGEDATEGICRRYPPQVTVTDDGAVSLQPFTDVNDYCGEHAPVLQ